jgi:hypothetical protein
LAVVVFGGMGTDHSECLAETRGPPLSAITDHESKIHPTAHSCWDFGFIDSLRSEISTRITCI